ncbi:hypothetical protein BGX28_000693 [Mortierella sp. GBA30]|nr:hypothetical protein BGX28_000693 [Mortierella sp. GBA30]
MYSNNYPPIFTSHGYLPSIFIDSSPKQTFHGRGTLQDPGQDSITVVRQSGDERFAPFYADYIQIWLDTHPSEVRSAAPALSHIPTSLHGDTSSVATNISYNQGAPESFEDENDEDSMEWESCLSSPMSRSVPDVDHRSMSPSPPQSHILSPGPDVAIAAIASVVVTSPVALAFRQHAMRPLLSFRGRSRCIFLAPDTRMETRTYRTVNELLHNTSIQRIRSWFKTTIEPNALEQCRNLSLFKHMTDCASTPICPGSRFSDAVFDELPTDDRSLGGEGMNCCPICFKNGSIMKKNPICGHRFCWKCEHILDQDGNISCPLCRGIRVASMFTNQEDLFHSTIGLHPRDYWHSLCVSATTHSSDPLAGSSSSRRTQPNDQCQDSEDLAHIEHELSDRYIWEPSASFLEYLQFSAPFHPSRQYFQLNAARDLCSVPSNEQYLPEYNDHIILEPPTSGLVLPPHRLYIALIHFCVDMLTFPNPVEFQNKTQFRREKWLLQLVALFLVPTDQFSPRHPERIFDSNAWVEHGQFILSRIHHFMEAKVRLNINEIEDEVGGGDGRDSSTTDAINGSGGGRTGPAVPSTRIPRHILYLGSERWNWISQSLTTLLTWIKAACVNPSMVPLVADWESPSLLGKRELRGEEEMMRPAKRMRTRTRVVVDEFTETQSE